MAGLNAPAFFCEQRETALAPVAHGLTALAEKGFSPNSGDKSAFHGMKAMHRQPKIRSARKRGSIVSQRAIRERHRGLI